MSARIRPSARKLERDALAAAIARHAPRGDVRAAEALAAAALNRRRRAEQLWDGALAATLPAFADMFADLPEQPISSRADAAWNAACRRIAARALAGAAPDPVAGAHVVIDAETAAPPECAGLTATARIGPFAFYRDGG